MSVSSLPTSIFSCYHLTAAPTALLGYVPHLSHLTGFKLSSWFILHLLAHSFSCQHILLLDSPDSVNGPSAHQLPRCSCQRCRSDYAWLCPPPPSRSPPPNPSATFVLFYLRDISQSCPLLSICLATRLFQGFSALQVSFPLLPPTVSFPDTDQSTALKTVTSTCLFHTWQISRTSRYFWNEVRPQHPGTPPFLSPAFGATGTLLNLQGPSLCWECSSLSTSHNRPLPDFRKPQLLSSSLLIRFSRPIFPL